MGVARQVGPGEGLDEFVDVPRGDADWAVLVVDGGHVDFGFECVGGVSFGAPRAKKYASAKEPLGPGLFRSCGLVDVLVPGAGRREGVGRLHGRFWRGIGIGVPGAVVVGPPLRGMVRGIHGLMGRKRVTLGSDKVCREARHQYRGTARSISHLVSLRYPVKPLGGSLDVILVLVWMVLECLLAIRPLRSGDYYYRR